MYLERERECQKVQVLAQLLNMQLENILCIQMWKSCIFEMKASVRDNDIAAYK